MRVFARTENPEVATVYMADMGQNRVLEFVEACQQPYPRAQRWILMVSTLFGCPIKCLMCDAGGSYRGKPSAAEILAQIDYMVDLRFPDRRIPAEKFKIQFARMGEPALNMAVLDALELLPDRYAAPGLMPSLSTIAPLGTDPFFERLLKIKETYYSNGRFQLQFSIHTTRISLRDKLIPVRKMDFSRLAAIGEKFHSIRDRKITLNFALAKDMPVDVDVLLRYFDPAHFLIKITPLNPTWQAARNGLVSLVDPRIPASTDELRQSLIAAGYEVLISIGEPEENLIGSNCGQYVMNYLESDQKVPNGYTYQIDRLVN